MSATAVEINRHGAEAIAELEPLWLALKDHHGACTPGAPVHDDATSWAMRRRQYEEWLAEDGAFLLIARRDGEPLGFALVRMHDQSPTWIEPERYAIVQDLAVGEAARGTGVGRALLDAVHDQSDCAMVELTVLTANDPAKAFYDRLGFELYTETLRRRRQ